MYFAAEAGGQAALRFIDALEEAVRHLSEAPGTGSLKFGYDLGIPELRAWRLRRFPYVIFYVPFDDYIDVWRVLRQRRDVHASLALGD